MAKFVKGQRVKCVAVDSDGERIYSPGDTVVVHNINPGMNSFYTECGLLFNRCFEPVIEESSAPMQNAEPGGLFLNVGDTVRVLEDTADYASVKKGDIGVVQFAHNHAGDYSGTIVRMEDGCTWVFNANKVLEIVSRVAAVQNAEPLVRPCTCPVGSGCATQTPCDGNQPEAPMQRDPWGVMESWATPPVPKAAWYEKARTEAFQADHDARAAIGLSLGEALDMSGKGDYADAENTWFDAPKTAYPDGNPKTSFGRAKPSTRFIPPIALLELGMVMEAGAAKYGQMNWRDQDVSLSVYTDAIMRHLLAICDGQDNDPETGRPHMAHIMAGAAIVLDAKSLGKLNDDRPFPGAAAQFLAAETKVAA